MLRTDELDYELPEELIATRPVEPRDAARLMVVSRAARAPAQHRLVSDLPEILEPGDLLIRNVTKVIPARLRGIRTDTGGRMEGLYLGPARRDAQSDVHTGAQAGGDDPLLWEAMIKLRRMKPGVRVELEDHDGRASGVFMELLARCPEGDGSWNVRVDPSGAPGLESGGTLEILDRIGLTPLPPYIRAARKRAHESVGDEEDRARYQTTFARPEDAASVAAPTAGLHFTSELDAHLRERGVQFAEVLLHVGLGTFKPVETEFVEEHPIHAEWCSVPRGTGEAIARTRAAGGRVIAVGTTTVRALESFESVEAIASGEGDRGSLTRLLITPGFEFRMIDGMMTNFHLPRSTLLAMVAAMLDGDGVGRVKSLYAEAVAHAYRFYSYGDAMLILP